MKKGTICLCYRKIIDQQATGLWEKLVFEDSYQEYRMQVQLYDPEKKYPAFGELVRQVPAAEKLHFLVSAAVTGYVQQLKCIIPDIINTLGKRFLSFDQFRFEIINSHATEKSRHQVAINFISEPLLWHDTVGNQLLLSKTNITGDDRMTDMVTLQPFLSIYSLKSAI